MSRHYSRTAVRISPSSFLSAPSSNLESEEVAHLGSTTDSSNAVTSSSSDPDFSASSTVADAADSDMSHSRTPTAPVVRGRAQRNARRPTASQADIWSSDSSSDFGEGSLDGSDTSSGPATPRCLPKRPAFALGEYELFYQDARWYTAFPRIVQTARREAAQRALRIGTLVDPDAEVQPLQPDSDQEQPSTVRHPVISRAVAAALEQLRQDLGSSRAFRSSVRSLKMIKASALRQRALQVHQPYRQRSRKFASTTGTAMQHRVVGGACAGVYPPICVAPKVYSCATIAGVTSGLHESRGCQHCTSSSVALSWCGVRANTCMRTSCV